MGLNGGVIASLDPYNDFEDNWGKGSLNRFSTLAKNNGLTALMAIGGWNEGSIKYSQMAATQVGRDFFADSVVTFVKKYNFDGLDVDWEYPTQRGGAPEDKENFSLLLETLANKLHAEGLMVTAGVAADPTIASEGYDFQKVGEYVDYINLMSYDYHTAASDHVTGINSPLHQPPGGKPNDTLYTDSSVSQWLNGGVPASKLVIGVPMYGRTYTLVNSQDHDLGAPVSGNGPPGPYTGEAGFLTYYEICMTTNWNTVSDDVLGYAYAYSNYNWVSYDDVKTVKAKANYVIEKGLAGIMIWSIESEDFRNVCGDGANPRLTAINEVFGRL
jgi:chitinase